MPKTKTETKNKQNSTSIPAPIPDSQIKKVEDTALTITEKAKSIRITNDREYAEAGSFLVTIVNAALEELDRIFDGDIRRWHEGHKAALAMKKEQSEPLLQAKLAIKRMMADYDDKKRREQERERLLLEQAQREAAEEEAMLRAQELQKEGYDDAANKILQDISRGNIEPSVPLPAPIHRPIAVEGIGVRRLSDFEIVDANKIDRRFMIPDEKAIRQLVKSMGERAEKIVGEGSIRVFKTSNIASGTRKG